MTKRTTAINNSDDKTPKKSPNPQEKKKSRNSVEETKKEDTPEEMTENAGSVTSESSMNLVDKFNAVAEVKLAGGKHIWKNLISGPKPTWDIINVKIKSQYSPFVIAELFGEPGLPTIHNLAAKGKHIRGLDLGTHLTAEGWKALFAEVFETETELATSTKGETMRQFGIRLALTDPKSIFRESDGVWKNHGLVDRQDTCAWTGAYMFFGAVWPHSLTWDAFDAKKAAKAAITIDDDDDSSKASEADDNGSSDSSVKDKNQKSSMKSSTTDTTKKAVGFTRQLFLSKPLADQSVLAVEKKLLKKYKKKHTTYMKFKTSRITAENQYEQEQEYVKMIHDLLKKLWQLDPDVILHQWNDINAVPLKRSSTLPTNKTAASSFINGAFLRQGQCAWVRILMGHNKSVDTFSDPAVKEWFRDRDMNFYKEKLQAKVTCKAGWLLGSNGSCLNPRDLEAALEMVPELQGIPIEIRIEAIRIEKGKASGVKAAHVLTPWDKALKCRIAMNMIYSKKSKNGHPLGKDMRFIPNIMDTRFITTDKTKMQIKKSISKQKYFLTKTQSATSYTIIGLDYVEPTIGSSLREILMGLRSNSDPEKNLFINVDEHIFTPTVTFLFHDDRTQEAMTAIPALPVILEAKLGTKIWNWFSEEAKELSAGYYWDAVNGLKSTEDDRMTTLLGDWGAEWGSDDDDDERSMASSVSRIEPFKIVTGESGTNQYYDDGSTVGTFKSAIRKVRPTSMNDLTDLATEVTDATSNASPASTLTHENWEEDFQMKMKLDPSFKQYILDNYTDKKDGPPKPPDSIEAADKVSGNGE
jgi:hypothetical protein